MLLRPSLRIIGWICVCAAACRAETPTHAKRVERRMPTPVDRLASNVADSLSGPNLLLYGAAIGATVAMSQSGADHRFRVNTQRHARVTGYGDSAMYSGYVLPFVVGPSIWVTGLLARDPELTGAGSATIQAAAVTAAVTGVLKWATGRPYPNHGNDPNAPDRLNHPEYAQEFAFRPLSYNGVLAWPSGHTSTNVAMAAALTAYYPQQLWIPLVAYPTAIAIGLGMVNGDHHWASDVVAGGLIGQAIGYTIGTQFRKAARPGPDDAGPQILIIPAPGADAGLGVGAVF
jgi:membrane-associated phospholipid phosphatase